MDEELYIRMLNGRPVDHPMLRSNIESSFPDVDFDNLPDWLARFERISKPTTDGPYEIVNGPVYVVVGDTVKDQWFKREMTEEERLTKQSRARTNFLADEGNATRRSTWVFDEIQCAFIPPIPHPTDGNGYLWSDANQNWIEVIPPERTEWIEGTGGIRRKPLPLEPGHWVWNEETSDWVKNSDSPNSSMQEPPPFPLP